MVTHSGSRLGVSALGTLAKETIPRLLGADAGSSGTDDERLKVADLGPCRCRAT